MGVLPRCLFLLLLACPPALAGPRPESRWGLRWNAPTGCIQAASLARGVEARLGRTVFGPDPEFLIDGLLTPGRPEGWTATLSLVDMRGNVLGSREVSTPRQDCAVLEPRLLLVLSLMIDPAAAFTSPPREAPSPPPPEPGPVEPPPIEPPPPAEPPEAPPADTARSGLDPEPVVSRPVSASQLTLAATGAAGLGFGVSPGAAGAVWWGPGQGVLTRLALYPYASLLKDGGRVSLMSGLAEVGVCPLSASGAAGRVSGCASASLCLMSAWSEGFRQSRTELLVRADVGPRLRLERRLSRGAALHVGLGAGWGWLRPTVRVLKPDGSAEDLPLGLPVQASVDLGMSFFHL